MPDKTKQNHIWWFIIIGAIIITLLFFLILKINNPKNNHKLFFYRLNRQVSYRHLPVPGLSIKNSRHVLNPNDLTTIDSWMTFDYLNKIFNLPPDYLKNSLDISNTRYPFLTINHYASDKGIDVPSAVSSTRGLIANYLKR